MTGTGTSLDVYQLAFLAGGADRVVDTALVVLVESGRIRVHAPGELAAVEASRRHPVEGAVLDAVGTHGHRSVDTIRWRLEDDDRIADLAQSLVAAGLLRRRRVPGRLRWTATRAGSELLERSPALDRSLDGGSAAQVALHGRDAMRDVQLRSQIFERSTTTLEPAPPHGRARGIDHSDPHLAAYRTGGTAASAGVFALFQGGHGDGF